MRRAVLLCASVFFVYPSELQARADVSHKLAQAKTRGAAVAIIKAEFSGDPEQVREYLIQHAPVFASFSPDTQLALLSYVRPIQMSETLTVVRPDLADADRHRLLTSAEAWNFVRELRQENPGHEPPGTLRKLSLPVVVGAHATAWTGMAAWLATAPKGFPSPVRWDIPALNFAGIGLVALGTTVLYLPRLARLWEKIQGPKEFLFSPVRREFGASVADPKLQRALEREKTRSPEARPAPEPVDPFPRLLRKLAHGGVRSLTLARKVLSSHELTEEQHRTLVQTALGNTFPMEVRLAILERLDPDTLRSMSKALGTQGDQKLLTQALALSIKRGSKTQAGYKGHLVMGALAFSFAAEKLAPSLLPTLEGKLNAMVPVLLKLDPDFRHTAWVGAGVALGLGAGHLAWRLKNIVQNWHTTRSARREAESLGPDLHPSVRRDLKLPCPGAFHRLDRPLASARTL